MGDYIHSIPKRQINIFCFLTIVVNSLSLRILIKVKYKAALTIVID
jgi:hypothetical protein